MIVTNKRGYMLLCWLAVLSKSKSL